MYFYESPQNLDAKILAVRALAASIILMVSNACVFRQYCQELVSVFLQLDLAYAGKLSKFVMALRKRFDHGYESRVIENNIRRHALTPGELHALGARRFQLAAQPRRVAAGCCRR